MSTLEDPGLFARQPGVPGGDPDPASALAFLAGLAGDGPALELAIGSGRVALPLAARGVPVEGIDASAEMVELLRTKPGGADLPVVLGDMADAAAGGGPYRLVYLIHNNLFDLTEPGRQEECFRNVARVLAPGGAFVIEAAVPDPERFDADDSGLRYQWPAQIDVFANQAGLVLADRFAGWEREPFTRESGTHVSVYRRTAQG